MQKKNKEKGGGIKEFKQKYRPSHLYRLTYLYRLAYLYRPDTTRNTTGEWNSYRLKRGLSRLELVVFTSFWWRSLIISMNATGDLPAAYTGSWH